MPDPQVEERRIPDDEFRADAEAGTFDGHASAFRFVDDHGTAFLPGAFQRTIKHHQLPDGSSRIPAVFFHDPEKMVGPVTVLDEDQKGLRFTARAVDDGQTGSYVLSHLRGGTPLGMSFAFRRLKDRAATEADGINLKTAPEGMKIGDVRAITEVAVREITVLPWTFASQPMAQITQVRSADLPILLNAIKADSLTDEQRALIAQIVTAWNDGPAPGTRHGTPPQVRRNFNAEYELLLMELGVAA